MYTNQFKQINFVKATLTKQIVSDQLRFGKPIIYTQVQQINLVKYILLIFEQIKLVKLG